MESLYLLTKDESLAMIVHQSTKVTMVPDFDLDNSTGFLQPPVFVLDKKSSLLQKRLWTLFVCVVKL